jgi:predicted deacylase
MHSHTGGIFSSRVHLRQEVKKGEILASIRNLLDEEIEVIRAPYDGIIIGQRTVTRIYPGDWTLWVGRIIEEV